MHANLSTAAKPEKPIYLNQLTFFSYQAVVPPLPNSLLIKCFLGFAVETAKALHTLHREGIAHLDVRTFNVGFRIVKPRMGQGAAPGGRAARAVLIDLDRGTWNPGRVIAFQTKCAQYARPRDWPIDMVFSAARCDWRQWALMVWSLLEPAAEPIIYSEAKDSSDACPFPFLHGIICKPKVGVDKDQVLNEITEWAQVDSPDMAHAKALQAELNTSDLTTEVMLEWRACCCSY